MMSEMSLTFHEIYKKSEISHSYDDAGTARNVPHLSALHAHYALSVIVVCMNALHCVHALSQSPSRGLCGMTSFPSITLHGAEGLLPR